MSEQVGHLSVLKRHDEQMGDGTYSPRILALRAPNIMTLEELVTKYLKGNYGFDCSSHIEIRICRE